MQNAKVQVLNCKFQNLLKITFGEDSDQSLMEIIKDDKFQLPIEMLEEENRFQQIVSILKILEEKRAVISLRFGLNEGEPQTLEAMKKMRKIFKIQKFVPQIYKDRPDRIPKFFAGQTL